MRGRSAVIGDGGGMTGPTLPPALDAFLDEELPRLPEPSDADAVRSEHMEAGRR